MSSTIHNTGCVSSCSPTPHLDLASLLTILGEYVLSRGSVWQETLVGALESMGFTTQAARRGIARSARDGWLTAERRGRRSRMTLTPETARLLRTGAERIYGFGSPWGWDGRWLLVASRGS